MGKKVDLTGQKFGRLVIIEYTSEYRSNGGKTDCIVICQCDCGRYTKTRLSLLTRGEKKSCGCLQANLKYLINKKYNFLYRFLTCIFCCKLNF